MAPAASARDDRTAPVGDGRSTLPAMAVQLAGLDTVHLSADIAVSEAIRAKLDREKEEAQLVAKGKGAYCPDWLGAQVLPHGSRGGYAHLLETDDFSVKILGKGIPHRPGLYIELRSHFLHTHPGGPRGACEEALCWARDQLLYDQDEPLVRSACSFESTRLSRVDVHADWQGGWAPAAELGAGLRFIKPARVKWHAYHDGGRFTGFVFGSGAVLARIYDKGWQARQRSDDAYFALLEERNPNTFNPDGDIWRLEFQLRREGATGFRLHAEPDAEDDDAAIEAELAAEELPHVGTLPRFFRHQAALWRHLATHWLRLVEDDGTANRSRWPTHPTWAALRDEYARVSESEARDSQAYAVVRGARYTGRARILRRLLLGVVKSLEVEDAAGVPAALAELGRWSVALAEREQRRAQERRARYEARHGYVPAWVERGLGERVLRAEQVKHRVQMLLGVFAARGVLPRAPRPPMSVLNLVAQHLDELEAEAAAKGGVAHLLADHFSRIYRVAAPADLFSVEDKRTA